MSADSNSGRITLYRNYARGAAGAVLWTVDRWVRALGRLLRRILRPWWAKVLAVILLSPFILFLLLWILFARDLPSADSLLSYEPPLPSYVRDIEGDPVHSFARERRVELQYDEFPRDLINAYLAAEDRTFFRHGGVDYPGFVGAIFDYARKAGSGERARGGSTITQQVAKNLLLGDEYSVSRKIRELYLNQIFLGRNAYGVQAAARAYFDRDVAQLELHQIAYLAILPKAPSNYSPERQPERALERRNWVLSEMERNNFITPAQRAQAQAQPLGIIPAGSGQSVRNVGGYFIEELRRQLVTRYGEAAARGPNGVYTGGLWIRSS